MTPTDGERTFRVQPWEECKTYGCGIIRECPLQILQYSDTKTKPSLSRRFWINSVKNYFLFFAIITPQAERADTTAAMIMGSAVVGALTLLPGFVLGAA